MSVKNLKEFIFDKIAKEDSYNSLKKQNKNNYQYLLLS